MHRASIVEQEGGPPLTIRINGDIPTFRLLTDTICARALHEIEPRLLDLLEIATTVFAADSSIKRGGDTRRDMGQDWRRRLNFKIPVRHPAFWSGDAVHQALRDAVTFLTDDRVSFEFCQKDIVREAIDTPYLDFDPEGASFEADDVILFSGGLDSFAGALDLLGSSPTAKVILVTHRSAQKAIPRQVDLGTYLSKRFPGRVQHIHVLARRAGREASDQTQRSRSFLFAALGQVIAQTFGARRVNFFENGIVSHNLPLSPQIVGTMATRTTHPKSLMLLDRLMRMIGATPAPTENRYAWLTKTEVVERIRQHDAEGQIANAVSCTSIREQTTMHTHCGACSQCLDRRFAVLAAGLGDHDFETDYATDVLFGARETTASRTMALEWTRSSLAFEAMDEARLLSDHAQEITRIIAGWPEVSNADALHRILRLHKRHAAAVKSVLERVVKERAADVVGHAFESSSLVALHLGQSADPSVLQKIMPAPLPFQPDLAGEDKDYVPDKEAPLMVSFEHEDDKPVVSVAGLCRIVGPNAQPPHGLKLMHDEDRERGVPKEDYRYTSPTGIPGFESSDGDTIRKNINRCRKLISDAWEAIHDEKPPHPLLIQNKRSKGYRLDPEIRITVPPRR
ncbi:hypothetical protein [Oceanibium sediminis]|uniref:hypothetical protein n=1 Tax=Oceanibium sediminis TaxID=2026339 RepID=UPI000DD3574F|nr:hypothetical protein [Oceanibium sediminis]